MAGCGGLLPPLSGAPDVGRGTVEEAPGSAEGPDGGADDDAAVVGALVVATGLAEAPLVVGVALPVEAAVAAGPLSPGLKMKIAASASTTASATPASTKGVLRRRLGGSQSTAVGGGAATCAVTGSKITFGSAAGSTAWVGALLPAVRAVSNRRRAAVAWSRTCKGYAIGQRTWSVRAA